MSKQTKKSSNSLPSDGHGEGLVLRAARIDRAQANAENRSFPIVLATEAPVDFFDSERMEIVPEVLRVDGVDLPPQIPMLDTHNGWSVRGVLGSIRDLAKTTIDGVKAIVGRAYFASDDDAVRTYQAYVDGHLTDFSVGARRLEVKYQGHQRIVLRSKLFEGSAVVKGADPNCKALLEMPALRAYLDPVSMKEEAMLEELKKQLIARGMPESLDGQELLRWAETNVFAKSDPAKKDSDDAIKRSLAELNARLNPAPAGGNPNTPAPSKNDSPILDRAQIEKETLERVGRIDDLCRAHGVEDKQRKEWVTGNMSSDQVASEILKRKAAGGSPVGGHRVEMGPEHREKFYRAAHDGLVMRAIQSASLNPLKALERVKNAERPDFDALRRCEALAETWQKPTPGYEQMRYAGLSDLARMFCEEAGVDVRNLPKQMIVQRAFALRGLLTRADDPGYAGTGSFSNLLLDAANKTLLAAYDEAPTSYQIWVRQAPSAADYKTLNRIRFGELPDPEVIPENGQYPEKQASDSKESYAVEKHGEIFSISLEAVVNDDLNAISRIPQMQGSAMRRKINRTCYAILTANAALSDGVALFHATSHGANLDTTALSVTALGVGFAVMRLQTGLSSQTILNLTPRYLITGATLAASAYQIQGSLADPAAGGSAAGNSNTANIYGPNGPRRLTVVEEGQLDATSTTSWYLAADPSQCDTVELTFLQGEESPVLSREEAFTVDAIKYKIRQSFAAKAIDYRGLYQGNT